jgi:hypothetical protein
MAKCSNYANNVSDFKNVSVIRCIFNKHKLVQISKSRFQLDIPSELRPRECALHAEGSLNRIPAKSLLMFIMIFVSFSTGKER